MKTRLKYMMLVPFMGLWVITSCSKDKEMTTDQYFPMVKDIIQNNCLACHSSTGTWAGRPVAFDSDSAISEQYAAIKAAVADPISVVNKRMPQGGTLPQSDIDIIVKWFVKGGKVTD